ncbi:MAG: HAMP domain-containing histidine kinase [Sphingomonadales bacterium]|nr:MAG: HAMP domain-containing histidine kinase [Sphingomonadales bacterium]
MHRFPSGVGKKALTDELRGAAVQFDLVQVGHAGLHAQDRQQRGSTVAFADGRHFDISAVPLPDGNALVTMLDTTDQHRVERALRDRNEALEAADRVKTAFVANMSYELRTPLTSIKGFAEMLHGGFAGQLSASGTEYSEAILVSVERLGALIDDVLDLTQSDDAAVDKAVVDIELVAHAAAEAIAPLAQEKSIDLAVENIGTAGHVKGDARRLRQAIEHLLRHAVLGTPAEGRVLLHLDGNARVARIIVSDDGPGMDAEAVAHAFDRFAQGGARNTTRALGLGLPLAKQFVEGHGGRIELISEPGEGTLVTVELPRS